MATITRIEQRIPVIPVIDTQTKEKGAIGFSVDGEARANADVAALADILSIDTGTTFFPHGTELSAKAKAKRQRNEWLKLPTVVDGMTQLRATVEAEDRRDHAVKLGDGYVNLTGVLCGWREKDGADVGDLVPSEVGWQRLGSFAPESIAPGLRSNVNAWLPTKREKDAVLRTRKGRDAAGRRELFAVVSTDYKPFDLDSIADCVAEHMPSDARTRVRYDGQRARVDVILQNPHHFGAGGEAGTVGELHRLTLRVTTADDGTAGFRLKWAAERIRCVNLTILRGDRTVFTARHTREDLGDMVEQALAAQGQVAEAFAARWRDAWTTFYCDQGSREQLGADEVLKRIAYHGLVRIPGIRGAKATYGALRSSWETEPGDSRAAVHNAITHAAHNAPTSWRASSWADDETEEQASDLLYQRNYVLDIPEEKREQLGW